MTVANKSNRHLKCKQISFDFFKIRFIYPNTNHDKQWEREEVHYSMNTIEDITAPDNRFVNSVIPAAFQRNSTLKFVHLVLAQQMTHI